MGFEVYWRNGRWQGYGVIAYCDFPGCKKEIDRGLGYIHSADDDSDPQVFCCSEHKYNSLESFEVEKKEHPEWIRHVLTDQFWEPWRKENSENLREYELLLKKEEL